MKKQLGFLFSVFGLTGVFMSVTTITGAVIGSASASFISMFYLVFVFAGILMLVSNQTLDTIIIPTGGKENHRRTARAYQEYSSQGGKPEILITGTVQFDGDSGDLRLEKNNQTQQIVKQLLDYGVKPKEIIIEGASTDTLENFLYSSEILKRKDVRSVGIATDGDQYARFKMFERKAKKQGLIPRKLHFYQLGVNQEEKGYGEKFKGRVYGTLAYLKDFYKTRKGLPTRRKAKIEDETKIIHTIKTALWPK